MNIQRYTEEISNDLLTVPEAKQYLRVTEDAEDAFINTCIESAVAYCENRLGYNVVPRISMLNVTDNDGSALPVEPEACPADIVIYEVTDAAGQGVEYDFAGGCVTVPASVPAYSVKYMLKPEINGKMHIKQAALLLVGKYFEQRGDESKAQTEGCWETVDRLLSLVGIIWV